MKLPFLSAVVVLARSVGGAPAGNAKCINAQSERDCQSIVTRSRGETIAKCTWGHGPGGDAQMEAEKQCTTFDGVDCYPYFGDEDGCEGAVDDRFRTPVKACRYISKDMNCKPYNHCNQYKTANQCKGDLECTVKNPEQWGNPANDQAPPDVYIEADNSAIICFQRSGHSDTFSEPSKDQGDAAAAGRHVHEGWKEPQQHANPANIAGNTDAQQSYGSFAVPDAEKEMQAFQRHGVHSNVGCNEAIGEVNCNRMVEQKCRWNPSFKMCEQLSASHSNAIDNRDNQGPNAIGGGGFTDCISRTHQSACNEDGLCVWDTTAVSHGTCRQTCKRMNKRNCGEESACQYNSDSQGCEDNTGGGGGGDGGGASYGGQGVDFKPHQFEGGANSCSVSPYDSICSCQNFIVQTRVVTSGPGAYACPTLVKPVGKGQAPIKCSTPAKSCQLRAVEVAYDTLISQVPLVGTRGQHDPHQEAGRIFRVAGGLGVSANIVDALEKAMSQFHSALEAANGNAEHLSEDPNDDKQEFNSKQAAPKRGSLTVVQVQFAVAIAKNRLKKILEEALPNNNVDNILGGLRKAVGYAVKASMQSAVDTSKDFDSLSDEQKMAAEKNILDEMEDERHTGSRDPMDIYGDGGGGAGGGIDRPEVGENDCDDLAFDNCMAHVSCHWEKTKCALLHHLNKNIGTIQIKEAGKAAHLQSDADQNERADGLDLDPSLDVGYEGKRAHENDNANTNALESAKQTPRAPYNDHARQQHADSNGNGNYPTQDSARGYSGKEKTRTGDTMLFVVGVFFVGALMWVSFKSAGTSKFVVLGAAVVDFWTLAAFYWVDVRRRYNIDHYEDAGLDYTFFAVMVVMVVLFAASRVANSWYVIKHETKPAFWFNFDILTVVALVSQLVLLLVHVVTTTHASKTTMAAFVGTIVSGVVQTWHLIQDAKRMADKQT